MTYEFQYISCYSLSISKYRHAALVHRFNTSHVTLYLDLWQLQKVRKNSFNTSHVTLYLMVEL